MREIVALEGLSREDWLAERRKGIGSSDVAAIMGLDKWRGPFDVYVDKITGEDRSSSLLMRLGQHLEDGIANAYAEETGSEVSKPTHMYGHDYYPWMLANVDRFTDNGGELGVLEVKMAHRYEDWEDGAPQAYELQCLHQLAVTGLPYADLAALLGGRELRMYRIERDDITIHSLIEIEQAFWEQVERREPPPTDARSGDSLSRLYRGGMDGLELDPSFGPLIQQLRAAKKAVKEAEAHHDDLANQLRAALGDYETGTLGGVPVVYWRPSLRTGFDKDRLIEDHPAIASRYVTSRAIRTLRLGKEFTP